MLNTIFMRYCGNQKLWLITALRFIYVHMCTSTAQTHLNNYINFFFNIMCTYFFFYDSYFLEKYYKRLECNGNGDVSSRYILVTTARSSRGKFSFGKMEIDIVQTSFQLVLNEELKIPTLSRLWKSCLRTLILSMIIQQDTRKLNRNFY